MDLFTMKIYRVSAQGAMPDPSCDVVLKGAAGNPTDTCSYSPRVLMFNFELLVRKSGKKRSTLMRAAINS